MLRGRAERTCRGRRAEGRTEGPQEGRLDPPSLARQAEQAEQAILSASRLFCRAGRLSYRADRLS